MVLSGEQKQLPQTHDSSPLLGYLIAMRLQGVLDLSKLTAKRAAAPRAQ